MHGYGTNLEGPFPVVSRAIEACHEAVHAMGVRAKGGRAKGWQSEFVSLLSPLTARHLALQPISASGQGQTSQGQAKLVKSSGLRGWARMRGRGRASDERWQRMVHHLHRSRTAARQIMTQWRERQVIEERDRGRGQLISWEPATCSMCLSSCSCFFLRLDGPSSPFSPSPCSAPSSPLSA